MANFCTNCGAKLTGKFCTKCGTPSEKQKGLIGYWQAKEVNNGGDDYGGNIKGTIGLTNDSIIFYRYKFFSGKARAWRTIPIRGIKSISRTPIFNLINIRYSWKPEKTGFFAKLFYSRTLSYKIKDYQSLIENIRKLNPNIKINFSNKLE